MVKVGVPKQRAVEAVISRLTTSEAVIPNETQRARIAEEWNNYAYELGLGYYYDDSKAPWDRDWMLSIKMKLTSVEGVAVPAGRLNRVQDKQNKHCNYCAEHFPKIKLTHNTADCNKKKEAKKEADTSKTSSQRGKDSKQAEVTWTGVCFNCQRQGHKANRCPEKQNPPRYHSHPKQELMRLQEEVNRLYAMNQSKSTSGRNSQIPMSESAYRYQQSKHNKHVHFADGEDSE